MDGVGDLQNNNAMITEEIINFDEKKKADSIHIKHG